MGAFAAATVGPREIAADSCVACRHAPAQMRCSLARFCARPRQRAELDHRFALDRDRVEVVRLELQRLVGQADRLAEQLLLLRDAGEIDERGAVARIDRQRGFEQVGGFDQLAAGDLRLAPGCCSSTDRGAI